MTGSLRGEGSVAPSASNKALQKANVHIFLRTADCTGDGDGSLRCFNATRRHLQHTALSGVLQKKGSQNIPGSSGGMSLSPSPVEQVNDVVIAHLCSSPIGLKSPTCK